MWKAKQCGGFGEATLLQVHFEDLHSSSIGFWSSVIWIGWLPLPCVGNGRCSWTPNSCSFLSTFSMIVKWCRTSSTLVGHIMEWPNKGILHWPHKSPHRDKGCVSYHSFNLLTFYWYSWLKKMRVLLPFQPNLKLEFQTDLGINFMLFIKNQILSNLDPIVSIGLNQE